MIVPTKLYSTNLLLESMHLDGLKMNSIRTYYFFNLHVDYILCFSTQLLHDLDNRHQKQLEEMDQQLLQANVSTVLTFDIMDLPQSSGSKE